VRVRDDFVCALCEEKIVPRSSAQAHHILEKSLYPELALKLDNGLTLHAHHHQPMVHTTVDSWKKFVQMFRKLNKDASKLKFAQEHEQKIQK